MGFAMLHSKAAISLLPYRPSKESFYFRLRIDLPRERCNKEYSNEIAE